MVLVTLAVAVTLSVIGGAWWARATGPLAPVAMHGRAVSLTGWNLDTARRIRIDTPRGTLVLPGVRAVDGAEAWLKPWLPPDTPATLHMDTDLTTIDGLPAYRMRIDGVDVAEAGLRAGVLRVDASTPFRAQPRYAALEELADADRR